MAARPLERLVEWKFASLIKFSFQLARRIARSRRVGYFISRCEILFPLVRQPVWFAGNIQIPAGNARRGFFHLDTSNHSIWRIVLSCTNTKEFTTLRFDEQYKVTAREILSVENFSVFLFPPFLFLTKFEKKQIFQIYYLKK